MPIMVRPKGKAKKIAYSILGTPANLKDKPAFSIKAEKSLSYEETHLIK